MNEPTCALAVAIAAAAALVACSGSDDPKSTVSAPSCASSTVKIPPAGAQPSWSGELKTWLEANGYSHLAANQGWGGGSGCTFPGTHDPVILLHGNANSPDPTTAFDAFKTTLLANGYRDCDVYAIAWIEQQPDTSVNHHKARYLKLVRDLIQAVKGYTGRTKVDVVGYSMGVNMGRKAIAGGIAYDDPARTAGSACDLGASLAGSVDTFLGVAGVNRGTHMCEGLTSNSCSENGVKIDSQLLRDLNGGSGGVYAPATIASRVYSIALPDDESICGDNPRGRGPFPCEVAGVHTSRIPGETGSRALDLANSGTNDYCDPAVVGVMSCDHNRVFGDAGARGIMLQLVRDNDETVLD